MRTCLIAKETQWMCRKNGKWASLHVQHYLDSSEPSTELLNGRKEALALTGFRRQVSNKDEDNFVKIKCSRPVVEIVQTNAHNWHVPSRVYVWRRHFNDSHYWGGLHTLLTEVSLECFIGAVHVQWNKPGECWDWVKGLCVDLCGKVAACKHQKCVSSFTKRSLCARQTWNVIR